MTEQQQNQQGESSFSKGMKVTFGVVFALFFLGVIIPCATCGGCAMLGGISEGVKQAEDQKVKTEKGLDPDTPDLEVTSIDYKVTKKNQIYWKYSYQMDIRNNLDRSSSTNLDVVFLDGDGFEIDTSPHYSVSVPAGDTKTVKGSKMITLPEAQNVASVEVK